MSPLWSLLASQHGESGEEKHVGTSGEAVDSRRCYFTAPRLQDSVVFRSAWGVQRTTSLGTYVNEIRLQTMVPHNL